MVVCVAAVSSLFTLFSCPSDDCNGPLRPIIHRGPLGRCAVAYILLPEVLGPLEPIAVSGELCPVHEINRCYRTHTADSPSPLASQRDLTS